MRDSNRTTRGIAVAVASFVIGSATSALLGEIVFDRTDLYGAMEQVHKQPRANILFPCTSGPKLTFKAPLGSADETIRTVALRFGKAAVKVNGVYVLEEPLPEGPTGLDRVRAAKDWARDNLPNSRGALSNGSVDALRAFSDDVQSRARGLSSTLGVGSTELGSLPPTDQATTVYLVRTQQVARSAAALNDVFNELQ